MPTPRPFNAQTGFTETPLGEINRQVQRMQQLGTPPATKAQAAKQGLSGFTQKILGIKNNPQVAAQGFMSSLLPVAASYVGTSLASALAQTMGTPGQSRMSMFGSEPFGGRRTTAPVYKTPLNNVTDADVQADKELRKVEEGYINPDPKRTPGGGLDTGDGKVKENPDFVNMENVNKLLGGFGIKGFTPNAEFNSNQLPTTNSNPNDDFSPEDAQVMGVSEDDARLMQSGGGVETVFTDGKESSTQIFKDPGSRAFLDYEGKGGSMGAFRAAERARGMVRIGGRNYIPNPLAGQDGESDFRAITDQERRDVNAGRITAQDLSNQYIQRITGADTGIVSDNLQTMGVPKDYRDALERNDEVFFDIGPDTDLENTVGTPIPRFSNPF